MRDPASADFQDEVESALGEASYSVEVSVLKVIADRLGSIGPEDSLSDVMKSIPSDMAAITRLLASGGAAISDAASSAIDQMAEANAEWAAPYYAAAGAAASGAAAAAVAEHRAKAAAIAEAVTPQALCIVGPQGTARPIREAFVSIVSDAVARMSAGGDSYGTAINGAVSRLASSGLRIRYESGTTRELYSVVRTHVMGNYRRAMVQSRWAMGTEFGADGVEVSAHANCAPDHLPYQGRRYTMEEFARIQGRLPRDLVTGANCRHTAYPVILGASNAAYSDEDLAKMARESNEKVTFAGLSGEEMTMTRYEATQYQRHIEAAVRQNRTLAAIAQDEDTRAAAADNVRRLRSVYGQVSASAQVVPKPERMYVPKASDLV